MTDGRAPRPGDILELEITSLTERGLGYGSIDVTLGPQKEERTYAVFVRKAIPGDRVRVRVEQTRRKRITAGIVEMVKPSIIRIEPRCPHFGRREIPGKGCGGCTLQSLSYRHQLAIKERMVKELMQDAGVDPGLVYPVLGMDDPWYYRNKMEFSFGDDHERNFALGLHPTGFQYDVLNLEACYLESEFVSRFIPEIRRRCVARGFEPLIRDAGFLKNLTIREGKRTGERLVELVTGHAEEAMIDGQLRPAMEVAQAFKDMAVETARELGEEISSFYWTQFRAVKGEPTRMIEHHLHGEAFLHEELHLQGARPLGFAIHPRAFFQPNTVGAEILYATALEATGLLGQSSRARKVLDLYCGTGTIGLCMAPFADHVFGIELQPDAVDNARKNAAFNRIDNITFFVGDVGKVLESDAFREAVGADDTAQGTGIDVVLVDPPRSGLLPGAVEQIKAIGAPRLVYVSCNPAALAENIRELEAGGYRLRSIQPVDMFPQTYHIENVALFERRTD
jgi:23S rRNA (uracil1939-C5)-methyltransferase